MRSNAARTGDRPALSHVSHDHCCGDVPRGRCPKTNRHVNPGRCCGDAHRDLLRGDGSPDHCSRTIHPDGHHENHDHSHANQIHRPSYALAADSPPNPQLGRARARHFRRCSCHPFRARKRHDLHRLRGARRRRDHSRFPGCVRNRPRRAPRNDRPLHHDLRWDHSPHHPALLRPRAPSYLLVTAGPGGPKTTTPPWGRSSTGVLYVRRRPTLPQVPTCSTIGAERLSFRVRNGAGRFPLAMITETLWSYGGPHPRWGGSRPLLGNYTVDARHLCRKTSPRPISIGQLRALLHFHIRPINPVVFRGPYQINSVGTLILRRASRLDAFSGYHFQT